MYRLLAPLALFSAATLLLATPAQVSAQPAQDTAAGPRGQQARRMARPQGTLPMFGLLRSEKVREELGLTDEQNQKLKAIADELREKMQSFREELRDLDPQERKEAVEKARDQKSTGSAQIEEKVKAVLSSEQHDRLKQIHLQMQGARALMEEEMQQALEMTEEQLDKLRNIRDELREKMASLRTEFADLIPGRGPRADGGPKAGAGRRGPRGEGFRPRGGAHREAPQRGQRGGDAGRRLGDVRKKLGELRQQVQSLVAKAEQETLDVLSPEQREKLEAMKGEPFEMPQRGMRMRGPRGGDRPIGRNRGRQQPAPEATDQ